MDWSRNEIVVASSRRACASACRRSPTFGGGGFSTAQDPVHGARPRPEEARGHRDHVLTKLRKVPGAVDVDSSLISGKPEIGVYIDRPRAADLGVSVEDTADALRLLVDGEQGLDLRGEGRAVRRARARRAPVPRRRRSVSRLLTVPSPRLGLVPLRSVVDLKRGTGPARRSTTSIAQRVVTLLANVAPGYSDGADRRRRREASSTKSTCARSYIAEPTGQTREMGRVFMSFVRSPSSCRSSSCTSCSRRSSSRGCTRSPSCSRCR